MATKFSELLKASMKSEDTEEWIDIYFTRPIGFRPDVEGIGSPS